ncbi:MAG: hypothetical protein WAT79_07915 [Saprospiraceae bacterium]
MIFQRLRVFFLFFCLLLIVSSSPLQAQYGIRAKVNFDQNANVNSVLNKRFGNQKSVFVPGYELGLDYWFALKKKRIEFLPEIAIFYASNELSPGLTATSQRFIFNFHTQIYALDLNEDCNCPTFAKQGPSINKGFFFHVTPGVAFQQNEFDIDAAKTNEPESSNSKNNQLVYHVGLGLGLDFGLNELITITPMVSYFFHSTSDYTIIETENELVNLETNFTQLQFQIRTGFRFDYRKSKYGRRR